VVTLLSDYYTTKFFHFKPLSNFPGPPLIKNYSHSKFALLAKLYLVRQYFYIKDYEKAINLCIEIVKTNDNFFIGPGDLYSTVYLELIPLYNKIDKAKTNPLFQKINRNYYNYDEIEKSYR